MKPLMELDDEGKKKRKSSKKKNEKVPRRTLDYQRSTKMISDFLSKILKGTRLDWEQVRSEPDRNMYKKTRDYEDWNTAQRAPTIDVWLWDTRSPENRIRIRFCLVYARQGGAADRFNSRPDHAIPSNIDSVQQMYDYISRNNFHFCVISFMGKHTKYPRRFVAGRFDSISVDDFVARPKYGATRKENHLYTRTRALSGKSKNVGSGCTVLIKELEMLIKNQYEK